MSQLIHTFNIFPIPVLKAAARLSSEIMTVSRVRTKPDLIQIKSLHPIPELVPGFNKSFEEVSLTRAEQIWRKFGSQLNVLWSGGIDSTLAMVALLMTAPESAKITSFSNYSSIVENPDFYQLLLAEPRVQFRSSSTLNHLRPATFITGDLGDQIFGSELLFRMSRDFGIDKLWIPYEQIVPNLFRQYGGLEFGDDLYERYRGIAAVCPFEIKTAFDFLWWWNFTQKWQGVHFRKKCFVAVDHEFEHFFDSDDFQLWALYKHHEKMGSTLESYKGPAKELIYRFDKNERYLKQKLKTSSPLGDKVYFFAQFEDGRRISNWTECFREIESRLLL